MGSKIPNIAKCRIRAEKPLFLLRIKNLNYKIQEEFTCSEVCLDLCLGMF